MLYSVVLHSSVHLSGEGASHCSKTTGSMRLAGLLLLMLRIDLGSSIATALALACQHCKTISRIANFQSISVFLSLSSSLLSFPPLSPQALNSLDKSDISEIRCVH